MTIWDGSRRTNTTALNAAVKALPRARVLLLNPFHKAQPPAPHRKLNACQAAYCPLHTARLIGKASQVK